MVGTIRSLDTDMRTDIHEKIRRTVENIAKSAGATAEVSISGSLPVTYNDPVLTERMRPTLKRIAGNDKLVISQIHTGGEDFAYYAEKIPGLFIFIETRPEGAESIPLHSPRLVVDEDALVYGVRALANMTVDYMIMETGE